MIRSAVKDAAASTDFDLHGLVGVRLEDASPAEVSAVARQLGPIEQPLHRRPDVVVRFVDRLELGSPLRLLGVDEAGYTDDAFVVLRSKYKTLARAQIPFDQIGSGLEITCERGMAAVPLLIPIVNLVALSKGLAPLHASAFNYRGAGVLVTGWAKGGKTETLLGFMANGAEYVGDDWIYLAGDGSRMYGIPEPIRLWDWHLDRKSPYRRRLGRRHAARLGILRLASRTLAAATSNRLARRVLPGHVISRLVPLLERQRYVQMAPHDLFNGATGNLQGRPDTLVFVVSHDSPRVTVERVEARRIVRRMVHSLREERKELISKYRMFRFGFPDRSCELIEKADEIERDRLEQLWADREAYVVAHPYPASPADLFEAIEPLLESPGTIPEGLASTATLRETAPGLSDTPGIPLHLEQGGR